MEVLRRILDQSGLQDGARGLVDLVPAHGRVAPGALHRVHRPQAVALLEDIGDDARGDVLDGPAGGMRLAGGGRRRVPRIARDRRDRAESGAGGARTEDVAADERATARTEQRSAGVRGAEVERRLDAAVDRGQAGGGGLEARHVGDRRRREQQIGLRDRVTGFVSAAVEVLGAGVEAVGVDGEGFVVVELRRTDGVGGEPDAVPIAGRIGGVGASEINVVARAEVAIEGEREPPLAGEVEDDARVEGEVSHAVRVDRARVPRQAARTRDAGVGWEGQPHGARPEEIERARQNLEAGDLVVDIEPAVDQLDDVVGTDRPHRIGRDEAAVGVEPTALEAETDGHQAPIGRFHLRLGHGGRGAVAGGVKGRSWGMLTRSAPALARTPASPAAAAMASSDASRRRSICQPDLPVSAPHHHPARGVLFGALAPRRLARAAASRQGQTDREETSDLG